MKTLNKKYAKYANLNANASADGDEVEIWYRKDQEQHKSCPALPGHLLHSPRLAKTLLHPSNLSGVLAGRVHLSIHNHPVVEKLISSTRTSTKAEFTMILEHDSWRVKVALVVPGVTVAVRSAYPVFRVVSGRESMTVPPSNVLKVHISTCGRISSIIR